MNCDTMSLVLITRHFQVALVVINDFNRLWRYFYQKYGKRAIISNFLRGQIYYLFAFIFFLWRSILECFTSFKTPPGGRMVFKLPRMSGLAFRECSVLVSRYINCSKGLNILSLTSCFMLCAKWFIVSLCLSCVWNFMSGLLVFFPCPQISKQKNNQ